MINPTLTLGTDMIKNNTYYGKQIIHLGTFTGYTKEQVGRLINLLGGKVRTNNTRTITHVIMGDYLVKNEIEKCNEYISGQLNKGDKCSLIVDNYTIFKGIVDVWVDNNLAGHSNNLLYVNENEIKDREDYINTYSITEVTPIATHKYTVGDEVVMEQGIEGHTDCNKYNGLKNMDNIKEHLKCQGGKVYTHHGCALEGVTIGVDTTQEEVIITYKGVDIAKISRGYWGNSGDYAYDRLQKILNSTMGNIVKGCRVYVGGYDSYDEGQDKLLKNDYGVIELDLSGEVTKEIGSKFTTTSGGGPCVCIKTKEKYILLSGSMLPEGCGYGETYKGLLMEQQEFDDVVSMERYIMGQSGEGKVVWEDKDGYETDLTKLTTHVYDKNYYTINKNGGVGYLRVEGGVYILQKNSKVASTYVGANKEELQNRWYMKEHQDKIRHDGHLTEDISFKTPTAAANFVTKTKRNGREEWINGKGERLRDN